MPRGCFGRKRDNSLLDAGVPRNQSMTQFTLRQIRLFLFDKANQKCGLDLENYWDWSIQIELYIDLIIECTHLTLREVNSCSILERVIFISSLSITQRFLNFQPGEVKTFQRGDLGRHGMFFKIVPKYSYKLHKNHRHFRGCWKRYGTKSRRAKAQSILPCNSAWPFKSRLEDFKVSDCLLKGLPITPT